MGPGAAEQAGSISWPDVVKGYMNEALFSLGLAVLMFSLLLFRFLCCHLVVVYMCFASTSQVISSKDWFFAAVKRLSGKVVSKMTYNVSSGILNPTLSYHILGSGCCKYQFGHSSLTIMD